MKQTARVPFLSLPFEWTPSMLREGALALLALNRLLLGEGYCTSDGYPSRIIFDGITPVCLDESSVIRLPENQSWPGLEGFKNTWLSALLLFGKGRVEVARAMLRDLSGGMTSHLQDSFLTRAAFCESERGWRNACQTLLNSRLGAKEKLRQNAERQLWRQERNRQLKAGKGLQWTIAELERLETQIRALRFPQRRSTWSKYSQIGLDTDLDYDGTVDSLNAAAQSTPKARSVKTILDRLRPRTVLDIACNRGFFCQLASRQGARACGIDIDETSLERFYADSKRIGTSATPLCVNAVAPATPPHLVDRPCLHSTERLAAECVFVFAFLHHLCVGSTRLSLDRALAIVSRYASRYLVVEFVPEDDERLLSAYPQPSPFYNKTHFVTAATDKFTLIDIFASHPGNRELYLLQKSTG